MSQPRQPSLVSTRLSTGSHGSNSRISFDSVARTWEVNVTPGGPGLHIITMRDSFVQRICEAFLSSRSPDFIRKFSTDLITRLENPPPETNDENS